jgi:glutamate-1-semialdehyde 2,1-aminomutase
LVQPYAAALWHLPALRADAPWYFARGEGARLWDHDGREFIDLEMGSGPVLLGYDHPVVRRALRRHLRVPVVGTLLHPSEVEVAELLVEMVPSAELVVFGKNGSDACTAAARVARAATGRNIILSSGFHGIHDWYIADCYPSPGLVPSFAGYVKNFAFNDLDGLTRLAEAHAGDIAAIMLDPANRETPRDDFLPGVRRIADAHGALLIFDEVLTGFRLHRGGGQALYGVTPDLTCLGKSLANGLPLSALVGRADLMQWVDRIFYGMTYQHDSVALAVSSACLRYYRDHDVAGEVARKGEMIRGLFNDASAAAGLIGRGVGPPSRFELDFWPVGSATTFDQQVVFFRALVERGVLPVRVVLPCELLTDADLEQVQRAFTHGCKEVARYLDRAGASAAR